MNTKYRNMSVVLYQGVTFLVDTSKPVFLALRRDVLLFDAITKATREFRRQI